MVDNEFRTCLSTASQQHRKKMMTTKSRIWIWLVFLGLLDALIPLFPIMTLILVYVLMERPRWFSEWVQEIYKPL